MCLPIYSRTEAGRDGVGLACYAFVSSCMANGGTNERMTPAGGSAFLCQQGVCSYCAFILFFLTFLQYKSNRIFIYFLLLYIVWQHRPFSINPLCSISANGEFPPVVTTPRLPFRPTIGTPPPSIRSPPMIFPTTDYCKCKFDCYHSAESERWSAQMRFHCTGELSPSPSVSFLHFSSFSSYIKLTQTPASRM